MDILPWLGKMIKFMVFRLLEHASVNQIFTMPSRQTPNPVPPLSSYHQPQDRGELLISTVFYFLFIYFPTLPCRKWGGVGNYAKSEFCFILFQYAHERKIKGTLNTKRFLQIPWDFDENDFSSAYFLKRTPTSNSLTNSDLILTIFIQKWQSWCCLLSIIVVYKR